MDTAEIDTSNAGGKRRPGAPGSGTALNLPCEFQFNCYGLSFRALARDRSDDAVIEFWADAGPLPYTAENSEARRRLQVLLRALRREYPGRVEVGPNQRLILAGEASTSSPLTALGVFQGATRYLLGTRELIALLRRQF
jgi:hypothetical protein